ncbi:MAG: acetyl-coenzyme A synthetase N-terminal domain-containing protein, partial [Gammaproteobacteria bacterium]
MSYQDEYRRSLQDPEAFWAGQAEQLHWYRRWERVLDDSDAPMHRWFAGAQLNTCYNALDRHVMGGRGGQAALIYDSPVTDTQASFSYAEML